VRFLGIGETLDLGDMYLRLLGAGHQVRVFAGDDASRDVMNGMVEQVANWRDHLDWVREAGTDGVVLVETASLGVEQDELRGAGFNVIGGSGFGDRLESDRAFGQSVLRDAGLETAAAHEFHGFDDAVDFIRNNPRRYVFKPSGTDWSSSRTYVGQMENGADMLAMLDACRRTQASDGPFRGILMEHVDGVEVGVGGFFDGRRFLLPANLDWEHKRFFPGDIGELTGEMGTVVTYRGAERIFEATLGRLAGRLAESGYCGYINLNTIVNERGIWPLEFTSRFGYPGFPILGSLHEEKWDAILRTLVMKDRASFATLDGVSVGVVLTVPPFPYPDGYARLGKGTPICFMEPLSSVERDSLHFGEVALVDGRLVTAGMIGYVMVVTGTGPDIESAQRAAYDVAAKVVIPNMRYRNDIGSRFTSDRDFLRRRGWME
jgi:phosphoribosylamine--glycine ligase